MFWGDFFANTLHLTAQELGAYTALIGHAWEHDGEIAVRDLQRIARVSNFYWRKIRPRLEQFFSTSMDPNNWIHERVQSELTKAAEISNKRKDAALQMHSKSKANGHAHTPPSTTTTTFTDASLGKGSKEPDRETAPAEPKRVAEQARQGMSPDPGNDYRSPPRTKSDNVLTPIPDQPPPEPPPQGIKRPSQMRQDG
jgi:uncharacterized protein YdaU (DUF1376 family)